MVEFIKNALGFIPSYFESLLQLVQAPKRFVAHHVPKGKLADGMIFFAISILLSGLLESVSAGPDVVLKFAKETIFAFALSAAHGAVLCLAWRIVRGDADVQKIFLVQFYYSGVLQLMTSCLYLSVIGAMRVGDAALYNDFMEASYSGKQPTFISENIQRFIDSGAFLPVMAVLFFGLIGQLVWLYIGWGAFREMNHQSKIRSALAAALFVLFCIPVGAVLYLIAAALISK